jgi:GTPase
VRALLVANKTDGLDIDSATAEFHALAMGGILPIAAAHGRGINALMQRVREEIDARAAESAEGEDALPVGDAEALDRWPGIRVALVGRPNVGKSTLINRLLGEERVVATPIAGTTRDSIFIPFSRDGQDYTLIDTAGIRRRGRVHEVVEKFSVIKTLKAIEAAHVVIMVLDARAGIADQDAHLLGMVLEAGRALVLAVNKWDGLDPDVRESVRQDLERKLGFLRFARMRLVSALHGTNVGHLLEDVREAHASAFAQLSTPKLSRLLESAVAEHQPPLVGHRRIKLRYAHQGGQNPPVIVIHGNQTESLPGKLQALPGELLPGPPEAGRHPPAPGIQDRHEPVRRSQEHADRAPAAQAQAPVAARETALSPPMPMLSARAGAMEPFRVMQVLAEAQALEAPART